MIKSLKFFDWPFFASVIILTLTGLLMIYSTGLSSEAGSQLWVRQIGAMVVGLVGLFLFANIDYHFFQKNSTIFYVLAVLLLFLVLFFGLEIRGASRWINLGLFNFQPSEFAKLAVIVLLAKFFQQQGGLLRKFRYVLWSAGLVLVPAALIALQPDLGSAAILVAVWLGLLLVSPVPRRYFLYLLVLLLILGTLMWLLFLADYQQNRIRSFLNPTADPLGQGYNVIQSIVAVGSGGFFGQGLARGLQSQLQFLPERQTDFIFASTVEELGIVGGALVLLLFFFMLWRLIRIIHNSRDRYGMYLSSGVFFLVLIQLSVNVGMNLGLLPVTGVTLPFLSFGGNSLVVMLWLVGMVESVARHSVPVRFA